MKRTRMKSPSTVTTDSNDPTDSNHLCCVHRSFPLPVVLGQCVSYTAAAPIIVKTYLKEGVKTCLPSAFPKAHYSNITGARQFRITHLKDGNLDVLVALGIQYDNSFTHKIS